ncbi:trypsin 3A1-like [Anopheles ziemanni]|uniref:trypsin 3A1-like n=1 Tax=Anopheles coustani TaxID=139045 RepID=UPI0026584B75|nr:trypsin 3A1-like [Anopheles coustani]XP_058177536.1 trypsin 3A1-like [Anopheles ziemanni]
MDSSRTNVLLLVLALVACTRAEGRTNLIVGGFRVDIEEVPYQCGIFRDERFKCGGTIIGPHWVVTAQHCVNGTQPQRYDVVVGVNTPKAGQLLPVDEMYFPADNPDQSKFDIALFRLARYLVFGPTVSCVPLWNAKKWPAPRTAGYISGYGDTLERSLDYQLKAAVVSVLPQKECVMLYPGQIKPYNFCAGFEGGKVDTCQGDSGGPLVVDGQLAGVTVFGDGCARPLAPGVYIAVSSFYNWVPTRQQHVALR